MDPTSVASATSILTALGLGKYVAGILSIVALVVTVVSHTLPYLPVATAASSGWYRGLYTVLRFAGGLYLKAAPTPNAEAVAAAAGVPPTAKP